MFQGRPCMYRISTVILASVWLIKCCSRGWTSFDFSNFFHQVYEPITLGWMIILKKKLQKKITLWIWCALGSCTGAGAELICAYVKSSRHEARSIRKQMLALLLLSSYHQASTISFKTKSSAQCNILIKKKHLGQEGFSTRLKIQSQKARVHYRQY